MASILFWGILFFAAAPASSFPERTAPEIPSFLTITPGVTIKAEVDLSFGEPLRRIGPDSEAFEYAPPAEANIFQRIVVTYDRESKQVSRLDAYFRIPHSADTLRSEMLLGKRVLSVRRPDGGLDEFYYPKFNGLILGSKSDSRSAVAVSYFCPRFLADIFADRSADLMNSRQYGEAGDEADKAVIVDPDYARGYLAQGMVYQAQKNIDEAITRFTAAANSKYTRQSRAEALTDLGSIYWNEKKLPEKAQGEFQDAVALAQDYYLPHLQYGRFLHSRKQDALALVELTRAVELDSKGPETRLELVSFLLGQKNYATAVPHCAWLSEWTASEAAASRDAIFRSRIHFDYAYVLSETGKDEQAIKAYLTAVKLNPGYTSAWNNLGVVYRRTKDFAKASECYREGLRTDPKHFLLNRNLAEVLLDLGRPEESRRQAEIALAMRTDDSWTMVDIARSWAARGKKKEAVQWVAKAVAAGYPDPRRLADDRYFEGIRSNGDFKKIILGTR